jgi:hypothetical protein
MEITSTTSLEFGVNNANVDEGENEGENEGAEGYYKYLSSLCNTQFLIFEMQF